jgi:dienelactone hydrolase
MPPILPTTADTPRPIRPWLHPEHNAVETTVPDAAPAAAIVTRFDAVETPRAVVLVLHGGKDRSQAAVTRRSLSWQRAAALGRTLGRRLHDDAVAVRLLRFRTVGWNGDGADKVADAHGALDDLRTEVGEVPVVLVGHSMGGRAACRAAGHPSVRGVVALAPWLPPGESVEPLTDRELHAAHGRRDRITRAADTRAYVERSARVASATSFTDMGDRGHYLLTGIHAWNAFTTDRVRRILG